MNKKEIENELKVATNFYKSIERGDIGVVHIEFILSLGLAIHELKLILKDLEVKNA
jgi:hypothetical protein